MNKEKRVVKNPEFTRIIQKKKFVKTASFVLYYQPRALDHARIGISVSKKLGNAVVRNRIKRQIRALADEVFDFDENYDFIIIARPVFLKRSFEDKKEELIYSRKKVLAPKAPLKGKEKA